jgi:hypothetical protein
MKKYLIFIFVIFINITVFANDGAYYTSGNQLIPISETDISIKKEILTLKKIRNKFLEVTVYYEFFNPGEEKEIIVGFEAFSPEGAVNVTPKKGRHPYMRDFTVELNSSILKYDIAYVSDSLYNNNGQIKSINLPTDKEFLNEEQPDFYYVYHFDAKFKKGFNIIKHTYNYDLSNSIKYSYNFEYVLTAAKRWSNKQIDDFTLILDIGEFETFNLKKSFFNNANDWLINGIGKKEEIKTSSETEYKTIKEDAVKFHLQKGNLIFHEKNFKINGDLFLYSENNYNNSQQFNYLPFSYYQQDYINQPQNDFQKKVLRNLPFARRGYVFQNQELNKFYSKLDWYIPNQNYEANVEILTDEEKKWLIKWK